MCLYIHVHIYLLAALCCTQDTQQPLMALGCTDPEQCQGLSPLNICWCDGSRAGLILTAFKALLMLSKLEEDFDTDCQTSNPSCFSSPGKHSLAP